jgi:hypothetical protein
MSSSLAQNSASEQQIQNGNQDLPGAHNEPHPPGNSWRPSPQSFEELGIPDQLRSVVEKELTSGENILWLGRQSRNPLVQPRQQIFLYISAGLIVFALGIPVVGGLHIGSLIFAAVVAVFGLVVLIPWLVDPTKSCKACYVVTNRRAMVVEMALSLGGAGPRATSYQPHQLVGLERRDHPSVAGAGDLILEYTFALPGQSFDLKTGAMFSMSQGPGIGRSDLAQRVPRGFFFIDQVREVERLIRTTHLAHLESALDNPEPVPAVNGHAVVCACGASVESVACQTGQAVTCPRCAGTIVAPSSTLNPSVSPVECREDGEIPAEIKAKALSQLDPSEKVVWLGQPLPRLILLRSGGYFVGGAVLALLALGGLSLVLMFQNAAANGAKKVPIPQQAAKNVQVPQPSILPNLVIPGGLFLASVGLAAVPFVRRHFALRTCYALTNRRALVYKEGIFGPTRESYSPLEVAGVRRGDSWLQRGSGDVIFRTVQVLRQGSRVSVGMISWQGSVKTTHYGFIGIADPQGVEKLVRETLVDRFVNKLQQAGGSF